MSEPTVETLVRRLDRLERENRRWKWMGSVVLVGLTAVVLMGQAIPRKVAKVVEAEEFILRDGKGMKRAELKTVGWGAYLGLDGPDGETRVTLAVLAEPTLTLYGHGKAAGEIRLHLGVNDEDLPYLKLHGKDGKIIWRAP